MGEGRQPDGDGDLDPGLRADRAGGRRMVLRALARQRRWLVATVVLSLLLNVLRIAVPLFVREAVDSGLDPYDRGALVRWGALVLAVSAASTVVFAVQWYATFQVALGAEADIRQQMFDQYQRLHFAFHDRVPAGELMARATSDLQQVQSICIWVPIAASLALVVLGSVGVLFTISASLALVATAPLVAFFVLALRFSMQVEPMSDALQQRLAEISGAAEESIAGIRVVKGFGVEEAQVAHLADRAGQVWHRAMALASLRSRYAPLLEQVPLLGVAGVLAVGGRQVVEGQLTLGELVAFNSFILLLVTPLRYSTELITTVARASASAARIHAVLSLAPAIADPPGAPELPPGPGEVRFEAVCFAYPDGPQVLAGVDLVLHPGESVALVGRTGSGKSTVARLLPRFYDVDGGRVLIDGHDVRSVGLASLRRSIALVFEDTFLFSDTIAANIAFARPDASSNDIERAAVLAGAHDFIVDLPHGYDTLLGESGFSLSGGQRQRIAIARAILAEPRVLVLDDATSAVDPTKEHEIKAALEEVARQRTTLVIGHRPATLALADRVAVLDGGVIVAQGTHDELLATSPLYAEILARAGEAEDEAELV